ncbi:Xylose isomerase-like protein (fragment) [Mesorhizobium prunaredense]|uniref:Xylose isomerase-like protein n=1 Tax=Mesorhizobium prunaredense TaxID=1631249 RepID=A0A1R3V837_9HYPH
MELRSAQHPELTLEQNIEKIAQAGFEGVSADWRDRKFVERLSSLLKAGLELGHATIRVDRDVAPTLLVETIRALRSA